MSTDTVAAIHESYPFQLVRNFLLLSFHHCLNISSGKINTSFSLMAGLRRAKYFVQEKWFLYEYLVVLVLCAAAVIGVIIIFGYLLYLYVSIFFFKRKT